MTIRAVLFDAGNTLLFVDYDRLAEGVGAAVGMRLTGASLAAHAAAAADAMEAGGGPDRERAAHYIEALLRLAGVPAAQLPAAAAAIYRMHAERHIWSAVDEGTPASLERLRAAGLKLGIVSNSDGRVEAALTSAGIRDYFDVVIDSSVTGFEKPDPRIFRQALESLDVGPADALYIGDMYDVDVAGALAAGMSAALVDPAGRHAADDVPSAASVPDLVDALARTGRLTLNPTAARGSS